MSPLFFVQNTAGCLKLFQRFAKHNFDQLHLVFLKLRMRRMDWHEGDHSLPQKKRCLVISWHTSGHLFHFRSPCPTVLFIGAWTAVCTSGKKKQPDISVGLTCSSSSKHVQHCCSLWNTYFHPPTVKAAERTLEIWMASSIYAFMENLSLTLTFKFFLNLCRNALNDE